MPTEKNSDKKILHFNKSKKKKKKNSDKFELLEKYLEMKQLPLEKVDREESRLRKKERRSLYYKLLEEIKRNKKTKEPNKKKRSYLTK